MCHSLRQRKQSTGNDSPSFIYVVMCGFDSSAKTFSLIPPPPHTHTRNKHKITIIMLLAGIWRVLRVGNIGDFKFGDLQVRAQSSVGRSQLYLK